MPKDKRKTAEEELDRQQGYRDAQSAEAAKTMESSRPTPTQRENDLAKMGVDVVTHDDDGSPPDPHDPSNQRSGMYETRDSQPAKTAAAADKGAGTAADKDKKTT